MGIVIIMGYFVSFALFGTLTFLAWWLDWNWFAKILFSLGGLVSTRNLYKYLKYNWKTGSATNVSMAEMLFMKK